MNRRELILLLGGALTAPRALRSRNRRQQRDYEQPTMSKSDNAVAISRIHAMC